MNCTRCTVLTSKYILKNVVVTTVHAGLCETPGLSNELNLNRKGPVNSFLEWKRDLWLSADKNIERYFEIRRNFSDFLQKKMCAAANKANPGIGQRNLLMLYGCRQNSVDLVSTLEQAVYDCKISSLHVKQTGDRKGRATAINDNSDIFQSLFREKSLS
jgi:hypothetical protein